MKQKTSRKIHKGTAILWYNGCNWKSSPRRQKGEVWGHRVCLWHERFMCDPEPKLGMRHGWAQGIGLGRGLDRLPSPCIPGHHTQARGLQGCLISASEDARLMPSCEASRLLTPGQGAWTTQKIPDLRKTGLLDSKPNKVPQNQSPACEVSETPHS